MDDISSLTSSPFIDVLEQRKYWRTGAGDLVRRKKMTPEHKANVLAYLMRNADYIVTKYAHGPFFFTAPDSVQEDLERMLADPQGWMLQQPFIRALVSDLYKAAGLGVAWHEGKHI